MWSQQKNDIIWNEMIRMRIVIKIILEISSNLNSNNKRKLHKETYQMDVTEPADRYWVVYLCKTLCKQCPRTMTGNVHEKVKEYFSQCVYKHTHTHTHTHMYIWHMIVCERKDRTLILKLIAIPASQLRNAVSARSQTDCSFKFR